MINILYKKFTPVEEKQSCPPPQHNSQPGADWGCVIWLLVVKENPMLLRIHQELPRKFDHIRQLRHKLVSKSNVLISRCKGKSHSTKGQPKQDAPTPSKRSFATSFKTKIISATNSQKLVSSDAGHRTSIFTTQLGQGT